MLRKTTHYELSKPDYNETADIEVINSNMDIIDEALNSLSNRISNTVSDYWNNSTIYEVGQYCIYDNKLWKCLVQHSGQTPTEGTYWTQNSIDKEFTELNSVVDNLDNKVNDNLSIFDVLLTTNNYDTSSTTTHNVAPIFRINETEFNENDVLSIEIDIIPLQDILFHTNRTVTMFVYDKSLNSIGTMLPVKREWLKDEVLTLRFNKTYTNTKTLIKVMPYLVFALDTENTSLLIKNVKIKKNDEILKWNYYGELFNAECDYYYEKKLPNVIARNSELNDFECLNGKKVIFIGDSITKGDYGKIGDSPSPNIKEKNYPYFFQKISNCVVTNIGVCGFDAIKERNNVKNYNYSNYDVAIIMLGTNLGLDGDINDNTTELGAYAEIIDWINETSNYGCKIYMLQSLFTDYQPQEQMKIVYKNTRILAQNKNVNLIDTRYYLGIDETNFDLFLNSTDKTHPNEKGYKILGEFVFREIIKTIKSY